MYILGINAYHGGASATIIELCVTAWFIYYKVQYNMDANQRKAVFAHIEEQKRIKEAQIAVTGKLTEWEDKDKDKEGD